MINPENIEIMIRKEYISSYIIYTLKKAKRIDILNSDIIKEIIEKDLSRINNNKKIKLVINLKGIKFIDSYGFRVLLELLELKDIFYKREIIIPEDKIAA